MPNSSTWQAAGEQAQSPVSRRSRKVFALAHSWGLDEVLLSASDCPGIGRQRENEIQLLAVPGHQWRPITVCTSEGHLSALLRQTMKGRLLQSSRRTGKPHGASHLASYLSKC